MSKTKDIAFDEDLKLFARLSREEGVLLGQKSQRSLTDVQKEIQRVHERLILSKKERGLSARMLDTMDAMRKLKVVRASDIAVELDISDASAVCRLNGLQQKGLLVRDTGTYTLKQTPQLLKQDLFGQALSVTDLSELTGLSLYTVRRRLTLGLSPQQIVEQTTQGVGKKEPPQKRTYADPLLRITTNQKSTLEAIHNLTENDNVVSLKKIHEALPYKYGSVSAQLQALKKRGFVETTGQGLYRLTLQAKEIFVQTTDPEARNLSLQ